MSCNINNNEEINKGKPIMIIEVGSFQNEFQGTSS